MKILVFGYRLVVSGTVVNAIDLAAALRDLHECDVTYFAAPGPMLPLVEEKGLRYLPSPDTQFYPTRARMSALRDAVRRERPDVVHVWEWQQCMDAYYSLHLAQRVPLVVTDMSMYVPRLLPKELPTTFGTPELVDQARAKGRRRVELLVPPVDVKLNSPDAVDAGPFRKKYGIADTDIAIVTVSRLDKHMKGDSLFRTMEVTRALGRDFPVRFILVGDGTARAELSSLADEINAELGRAAIVLTGALVDPRPAYAAADIVLGMGGSALRGMAFGQPVVIMGDAGFSGLLDSETADNFYYTGMYGIGSGSPDNSQLLADIRRLIENPSLRSTLGQFSREFVLQRFSLETVSASLATICSAAANSKPSRYVAAADGLRTAAVYLRERRFLTPLFSTAFKKN